VPSGLKMGGSSDGESAVLLFTSTIGCRDSDTHCARNNVHGIPVRLLSGQNECIREHLLHNTSDNGSTQVCDHSVVVLPVHDDNHKRSLLFVPRILQEFMAVVIRSYRV
jgi:hypothetical protein